MKYLESPIFYMGNKYKLLKQLIPLFPKQCDIFLDLFGGSGVVSMNYKGNKKTIYNEFNTNISELVKMFKENDVEQLDDYFNSKIKEYNICCTGKDFRDHLELQKGYYDFRKYYNNSKIKDKKDLYLLSCYSMNHLIRFNKNNEFNASCGSTQRYIKEKIVNMHDNMQNVDILNKNCFDIDFSKLNENDFVYCDPPYLNTEAVYNEKRAFGGWNIDDDYKLFDILEKLNNKGVKWGLSNVFVNRGKENTHLIEWCNKNNWNVYHLNRNYNPFSRGNSNNDEVYICNYEISLEDVMLTLPIKKKWFDMILSGEKKEEYREIKPYYTSRFNFKDEIKNGKILKTVYSSREILLRNGYSNNSPTIKCRVIIEKGKGKPEWGAEPNKEYYVLKILSVEKISLEG